MEAAERHGRAGNELAVIKGLDHNSVRAVLLHRGGERPLVTGDDKACEQLHWPGLPNCRYRMG